MYSIPNYNATKSINIKAELQVFSSMKCIDITYS